MSYVALYRKWRPGEFEEVKGQEHIVTTLKNQIKHDRIGHAYIFCGTRGTGKTTLAKLLAKAVNCEHPVDGSPCNECDSCRMINSGTSINVIEIDAASNNGVDNIRQINEAVQYSPSQGKYLVYIIDEVHMLSAGAFNALLKTLEEPPKYVIFILATTDVHKVPITILSRCQRYDFKRISIETISDRLEELMKRENIPATREALEYVAKAADGSLRDALSILDQCISFNLGEELTYDKVLNTVGAVDIDVYLRMAEAIAADDINKVLETVNDIVWQGRDLSQFVNDFIWFVRNMLFLKLSPAVSKELDLTTENVEKLTGLGQKFSEESLIRYLNILQELSVSIKYSSIKRVTLEMAMIKMCRPEMQQDYSAILERIGKLETKTEELEKMPRAAVKKNKEAEEDDLDIDDDERLELFKQNIKEKYEQADYDDIMKIVEAWKKDIVPKMGKACKDYIKFARVVPSEVPGTINIMFANNQSTLLAREYFSRENNIYELEQIVSEAAKREVTIKVLNTTGDSIKDPSIKALDISKINFKNIEIIN